MRNSASFRRSRCGKWRSCREEYRRSPQVGHRVGRCHRGQAWHAFRHRGRRATCGVAGAAASNDSAANRFAVIAVSRCFGPSFSRATSAAC